ncbi:hypothetical protein ACFXKF_10400 [Streptomyces scopuliridis]|uniref:hypothetical protein n=1 Tax=Streptomyces scopuliridis TaxID=452529 RepID=UPI003699A758
MMHGTLIAPLPSAEPVALREGVEVFGGADAGQPVRVEVRVRACLSFAELLGLFLFTPGLCFTYEELEQEDVLRDSLQFALLDTSLASMEVHAELATSAYRAALAGEGSLPPRYVVLVAQAITRLFGVAA